MATITSNPQNTKRCAYCKRWTGDADLVLKPHTIQFTAGEYGKCLQTNSNQASTNGGNCKYYAPSIEADKYL